MTSPGPVKELEANLQGKWQGQVMRVLRMRCNLRGLYVESKDDITTYKPQRSCQRTP